VCEELRSLRSGMDAVAMALEKENLRNYTEEQLYDEITNVNNHPLSLSLVTKVDFMMKLVVIHLNWL